MKPLLKKHKELLLTLGLVLGPLLILIGIFLSLHFYKQKPAPVEVAAIEKQTVIDPFINVSIEAKAAYVKNLQTGEVLFSKNENLSLPLASITKIMTALTAEEILGDTSTITIDASLFSFSAEPSIFYSFEHFNTKDFIDFTLVGSSNEGAAILATQAGNVLLKDASTVTNPQDIFIQHMNILAKKIGMEKTFFYNPTGLDTTPTQAGASGSVKDVTQLFEYVLKHKPSLLEATTKTRVSLISEEGVDHSIDNTNEVVTSLPNIIGSKTGLEIAGGNLAVIIDPSLNTPISIVVLGSSKEGRFTDVKKLSDTLITHLQLEE